jgi:prepilin-type N-terminal cleavage/methylation domain-containing protein
MLNIQRKKQAFSLVELSIVLIIIGLLIGSISAGSKLILQAKLNKLARLYEELNRSTTVFYLTYDSYPGDIANISSFFSGETDGDGDNILSTKEGYQAWRHLALADILTGSYDGTSESPEFDSGDNIASKIILRHHATIYSNSNTNYVCSIRTVDTNWEGTISSDKAYMIDHKIDDGSPESGDVISFNYIIGGGGATKPCAIRDDTSAEVTPGYTSGGLSYQLNPDEVGCSLMLKLTNQLSK